MSKTIADYDVSGLNDAELTKMEREIARKYMDKLSIPMVVWPILNVSCWLALWPLVLTGVMPLWLGFIIATLTPPCLICRAMRRSTIFMPVLVINCAGLMRQSAIYRLFRWLMATHFKADPFGASQAHQYAGIGPRP